MLQYDFNESYTDIFELNFAPCLSYLQKINVKKIFYRFVLRKKCVLTNRR